jgi:hypothetical protein
MDAKKRESEREPAAALPHYHGHRERLRERFPAVGPDALSGSELAGFALVWVALAILGIGELRQLGRAPRAAVLAAAP